MTAVVDAIVAAFNRRDLGSFVAGYTEDIVIEDARGMRLVTGADELRRRYAEMFARCPALSCEVVSRIVVGEYVVDEEVVAGRAAEPERLVVVYHVAGAAVDHERIVR